jgi:hypothetical protein
MIRRAYIPCVGLALVFAGCGATPPAPPRSDNYLIAADSPAAIRARKEVLAVPSPEDKTRVELLSLRIMVSQLKDGSWAHDPTATGKALCDLHFLGALSKDDADLRRALNFLLGQEGAFVSYGVDSPVWGKNWVALHAVNLWGYGDELKVRETVSSLLENQSAWLDRQDGRAASVILRAIAPHPLLADKERRDALVRKLLECQGPGGEWDLGPGTSQLAVLCGLLPMASTDARLAGQVARFLPNVVRDERVPVQYQDGVLGADEAHLVVVRALDLAGKLDSYRRGDGSLAQYEVALYTVAGGAEKSGHTLMFDEAPVKIGVAPLLVGSEIKSYRQILTPEKAKGFLRLFLADGAKKKAKDVLAADPAIEAVVVLSGRIVAKGLLAEMMDGDGLAIRGLAEEDATKLVQAVGKTEGAPVPAAGAGREKK